MPEKIILLSYPLSNSRSYYGGAHIRLTTSIKSDNDRYNQETAFDISSHSGTHMDFPAHFYPGGRRGEDYPPETFVCTRVALVEGDLLGEDRPVDARFLNDAIDEGVEALLIKTGFCGVRDEERYWKDSPVVSAGLPEILRGRFPALRMVGFDLVSVTSRRNKAEGRKAHLNFLDSSAGKEIILIEDMDLREVGSRTVFSELVAAPLFFEEMDGSPCTVIARVAGQRD